MDLSPLRIDRSGSGPAARPQPRAPVPRWAYGAVAAGLVVAAWWVFKAPLAIARALATDPKLILADEPTGDLDRATADQVLELLVRLNREFNKTIIMVTHDPLAASRARTIVHLDKGRLGRIEENPAPPPVDVAAKAS